MNVEKGATLGVAMVVLWALAACSTAAPSSLPSHGANGATATDPPHTEPEAVKTPGEGQGSASPGAFPMDAGRPAPPAQPAQPVCGGLKKDACETCCGIAFADVQAAFKQMLGTCICDDPGECASACGTNQCAGAPPSRECQLCLNGSQVCAPAALSVCSSSPDCTAYLTCIDGCAAAP
jgi:hypothetical protein